MLWVYIIAAVGLVGIMVETWLSYRKEAAHQKKVLAGAAKQLGEMIVQLHQALLRERQSVEEGATGGLNTAFVEAEKGLFPGVLVRIGDSKREVKSPMKTSRFQLQGGVMAVR